MIEFSVFGSIELHGADGEEVIHILSQPKRLALLAYLAAAIPRGFHRRDEIVGLFWPELDKEHARAGLRRALHYLRRFLGKDVIIGRGEGEVGLDWEIFWCDVKAFQEALKEGKEETAIQLYRGDLLSGLFVPDSPGFEHWLDQERAAQRKAAATAMWTVSHRLLEVGQVAEGERMGQKALRLVPTAEIQVQRFMSALAAAGNRAAAIQFYERFSVGIRTALDLEPSAQSKLLARKIRGETLPDPEQME